MTMQMFRLSAFQASSTFPVQKPVRTKVISGT